MSRIVWDQVGEHWMETGTDHGVVYTMNSDGTYAAGAAFNGLRGFEENPEGGEPEDFYADNIKYASIMSAENYKYNINSYTYPDEWNDCLGYKKPVRGVYLGQQARKAFGFTCRTLLVNETASESDDAYKIHIIYNSLAAPSQQNYETVNATPAGNELSFSCSATPVPVAGHKPVSKITIDSRDFTTTEDKAKLKALEDLLYGKDAVEADAEHGIAAQEATEPTLPTPDEILELLAA